MNNVLPTNQINWVEEFEKLDVSMFLEKYKERFDEWWSVLKDKWATDNCWSLAHYCSEHFSIWWPVVKDKCPTTAHKHLYNYCKEHINIWLPDIMRQIGANIMGREVDDILGVKFVSMIILCKDSIEPIVLKGGTDE